MSRFIDSMSGIDLDWVVSQVEGFTNDTYLKDVYVRTDVLGRACLLQIPPYGERHYVNFSPTRDHAQGGAIIAREGISMSYDPGRPEGTWRASKGDAVTYGQDFLITAMRCHCIDKLCSRTIDLPPPFDFLDTTRPGHETET